MTEIYRLLLVDDEARMLSSVRRLLRPLKEQWQLETSESAYEALEHLQKFEPHLVISDMRMPGMSGDDFLIETARRRPETIRAVITGYSTADSILTAVQVAHLSLTKPFGEQELYDLLERARVLVDMALPERSRRHLGRLNQLPVIPEIQRELTMLLQDTDETPVDRVVELIEQEPSLVARILHTVNSAFFGLPRKITGVHEAVMTLGLDMLRDLVMVLQLFSEDSSPLIAPEVHRQLLERSLQVATQARQIAHEVFRFEAIDDQAFLAGVLHDVGKLALWAQLEQQNQLKLLSNPVLNEKLFGDQCVLASSYMLRLWNIDDMVVEAVEQCANLRAVEEALPLAQALNAAIQLVDGAEQLDMARYDPALREWCEARAESLLPG